MASVYIATLAHSENGPFGSKVAFGRAVEEAFVQVYGQGMVLRWASCEEQHTSDGQHYHTAIHLQRNQRFRKVHVVLKEKYGVSVHFSKPEGAGGYLTAYKYISKEDQSVAHSLNHPPTEEMIPPRTQGAMSRRRERAGERRVSRFIAVGRPGEEVEEKEQKPAKLQKPDVARMAVELQLTTLNHLYNEAEKRRVGGDPTLYNFVFTKGKKICEEVITMAHDVASSAEKVSASGKSLLEILDGVFFACPIRSSVALARQVVYAYTSQVPRVVAARALKSTYGRS